ncbi:MAG TPA: ParB N-terminal domain-containing protein [Acetobacteraceae bacterium]|jgi:hypothetical protein|nr:ParB N-terminal domain-containing protein [Acetobacteraceae bacterium]
MARKPAAASTEHTGAVVEADVPIDSLIDNPRNPNVHPEQQITALMASLRVRGQYRPVLARQANRMLVTGHGVREAAKRLGWETIRVAFWDVDQVTADQAMLGDNRLGEGSARSDERVAELLREIPEDDWLSVGFTDDEAASLLRGFQETELVVREIAVSQVYDQFWISVRGPLVRQAMVLQQLKTLLAEYRDVTVELGVIKGDL